MTGIELKPKEWFTGIVIVKGNNIDVSIKTEKGGLKKVIDKFEILGFNKRQGTIAIGSNLSKIAFSNVNLVKFQVPYTPPKKKEEIKPEGSLSPDTEDADGGPEIEFVAEKENTEEEKSGLVEFQCHENKNFNSRKLKCLDYFKDELSTAKCMKD